MSGGLILGIDQGTTGTTVLLVEAGGSGKVVGRGYAEIPQSYPAPGQVEHDPEALWQSVLTAFAQARARAGLGSGPAPVEAIGLTNQRETVVLWDRRTGAPVGPAIVWQDRRTADACEALRAAGHEPRVQEVTGLRLDPYFSATKLAHRLDADPALRARAERGELAFGTVDAWLAWRLSGGQRHVTDVSNASRTLLLDLRTRAWSDEMLSLFRIPAALLPTVVPCAGRLAETRGVPGLADGTPVTGMAGDQQAALFGQRCFAPGDAKCTYGTGAFLLMNVGPQPVPSRHRLLASVAWTLGEASAYVLEGSAFVSGALVQWLRDGLGIITSAAEIEPLARSVPDSGGVVVIPALAGLGAPHWRPEARGLIAGITRGTTRAHIARAALEAMALQNVELVRAMEADAGRPLTRLRVDGGATANDLLMQLQADLLGVEILRPSLVEATALGAVRLAARGAGLPEDAADEALTRFAPSAPAAWREDRLARWKEAVARA
jgi:glycerol kinase